MNQSKNPKPAQESNSKVQRKKTPKKYLPKKESNTDILLLQVRLAKNRHTEAKNPTFSRHLFTDGFNSFSHFALGMLSIYFKWLVPTFTFYQLLDPNDVNMYVDILEFIIGYTIGLIVQSLFL